VIAVAVVAALLLLDIVAGIVEDWLFLELVVYPVEIAAGIAVVVYLVIAAGIVEDWLSLELVT
jgi:hypothetical protein